MADVGSSAALLSDEERKKLAEGQGGGFVGAQQGALGGGGSGVVGGSQGVSTAGVGAGGTGGWTNIQAYLSANKQDTGTADYLQNKVGTQFESETKTLGEKSTEAKANAQTQVDKITKAKDTAKDTIDQAAQAYSWDGNDSNDPYKNAVSGLQSSMYDAYSGPNAFTYAFDPKTAGYKTTLGDQRGFTQFLDSSYRDRSGKAMTSGQLALQRQLDTTNDRLASTRDNLLKQYAGLEGLRDTTVKDTDAALAKAAGDYRTNQNALNDFVGNYGTTTETQVGNLEADARLGYQNAYKDTSKPIQIGSNIGLTWNPVNSYEALEDSLARFGGLEGDFVKRALADEVLPVREKDYARNAANAIYDFRNSQREARSGTADADKKKFNTIMELLKNDTRKKRGFNVLDEGGQ